MSAPSTGEPAGESGLRVRNLAWFAAHVPALHRALSAFVPSTVLEPVGEGDLDLRVGGRWYFGGGARAHARRRLDALWRDFEPATAVVSEELFERWGDEPETAFVGRLRARIGDDLVAPHRPADPSGSFFAIVFGLGLGFQFPDLLERSGCRHLIVVEDRLEMIHHSTFTLDWAGLAAGLAARGGGLHLVSEATPKETARHIWQKVKDLGPSAVGHRVILAFDHTDSLVERHNLFRREYFGKSMLYLGFVGDEIAMVANSSGNLVRPGVTLMGINRAASLGVPVVVVGSGPSLDRDLETLAAVRDRAVVVSCGSVLPVLFEAGIVPDYHMLQERLGSQYPKARAVADAHDLTPVTLIASTTVSPDIPPLFGRTVLYFRPGLASTPIFCRDRETVFPAADPEVGNAALNFVLHAGFREVVLLGLDMGSRDPSAHHAAKSYSTSARAFTLPTAGNHVETVFTHYYYLSTRENLEAVIHATAGTHRYVNCSDGARIEGAAPGHLAEVAAAWAPIDRAAATAAVAAAYRLYDPGYARWAGRNATLSDLAGVIVRDVKGYLAGADLGDIAFAATVDEGLTGFRRHGPAAVSAVQMLRGSLHMMFAVVDDLVSRARDAAARDVVIACCKEEMNRTLDQALERIRDGLRAVEGRDGSGAPPPARPVS